MTDNLAIGALIAVILRSPAATPARVRMLTLASGLFGAVLLALGASMHILSRNTAAGSAFQPEPFLFLFAALLLLALQYGDHPRALRLTGPLRFFGYISYGLYLFHILGFWAFQYLFLGLHYTLPRLTLSFQLVRFCVVLAGTSIVCFLSRRYFEEYLPALEGSPRPI